jgi:hypothetical protein
MGMEIQQGAKEGVPSEGASEVYLYPLGSPNLRKPPNSWSRSRVDTPLEDIGKICTMKDVGNIEVHNMALHAPRPPVRSAPTNFWEAIKGWGNKWLWANLVITGDTSWIAKSIADNSCMAITNGSHMKEVYPNLNSAAFVFECSKG